MKSENRPTVPEVLPLAQKYYQLPGNGAGGNLHVVLDECNVDTDHIVHCIEKCKEKEDYMGLAIACLMLHMSKTQRLKISSQAYRRA